MSAALCGAELTHSEVAQRVAIAPEALNAFLNVRVCQDRRPLMVNVPMPVTAVGECDAMSVLAIHRFGNASPNPVVDVVGFALPAFATRHHNPVIENPWIDAHVCPLGAVSLNAY